VASTNSALSAELSVLGTGMAWVAVLQRYYFFYLLSP